MTTQITINGQTYDAGSLTLPGSGRAFRSAWTTPINGVVQLDAAKLREMMIVKVKDEAQRRIIALTGADDLTATMIKQLNASMRATEFNNKLATGGTLTTEEQAEATALQALADAIKAIRAASNVLEAMDPIPSDYDDNSNWP
jgi:hypothetical protein